MMLKKEKNEVINRVVMLNIADIHPNPLQPRKSFDDASLEELRQSIASNGLLQPVTVRRVPDGYELVSGERRLRACKLNRCKQIPSIIVDIADDRSGVLALIENIQRRDLNFLEEAAAIRQLMTKFGLSQSEVSQKIGKSQPCIANKMRLLQLPEAVRVKALEFGLNERQTRALLRLSKQETMERAIEVIAKRKLNAEATDAYIESLLTVKKSQNVKFCFKDIRLFNRTIEKALKLINQSGIHAVSECKESPEGVDYWIHIPARKAES